MAKEKDGTEEVQGTTVNGSEDVQGTIQKDSQDVGGITKDGTQENQSTTVEKKKLSDIDPDELTDEQLEKLDLSEFEIEEEEQQKVEKETGKKDQADDEANKENIPPDSPSKGEKDSEEEEPVGDPLRDTKAALTKAQQERAELEKEKRRLETELRKMKAGSFEELSAEELEELKWDDPDAYAQYVIDKHEYEQSQKNMNQDIERERMELQFNEITRFVEKQGIDVKDENNLKKFLGSDRFKQLDQFVLNNLKPNAEGLYSSEQMDRAYRMLFADELLEKAKAEAKIKGVQETVDNITRIQKNGGGGSDLDRIKKTGTDKPKSATELTQEDIDNMSETELDQYEKELAALEKG